MKSNMIFLLTAAILLLGTMESYSQEVTEPEFIGEALIEMDNSEFVPMEKKIGQFITGTNWAANSWNATTLEVEGKSSDIRASAERNVQIIIKAVDNNSDPMSIITVYSFKSKRKKRTCLVYKDNRGTYMKSKSYSENLVGFTGKKYGESSYIITISNAKPGEYGVVVVNPNNKDEKKTVVSCFGVGTISQKEKEGNNSVPHNTEDVQEGLFDSFD